MKLLEYQAKEVLASLGIAIPPGRVARTPDEAADMIAEAVRTKPAYVATQLGTAMELVGLLAPAVVQAAQSRAYRRSLETERRIRSSSGAHRPVHGLSMAA
jgi:hypothetical protein